MSESGHVTSVQLNAIMKLRSLCNLLFQFLLSIAFKFNKQELHNTHTTDVTYSNSNCD